MGRFVLLYFVLLAFTELYFICVFSVFFICLWSCIFKNVQREWHSLESTHSLSSSFARSDFVDKER